MEGWFGIECPRINLSSLDDAEFRKVAGILPLLRRPAHPQSAHPFVGTIRRRPGFPSPNPAPQLQSPIQSRSNSHGSAPAASLDARLLHGCIGQTPGKVREANRMIENSARAPHPTRQICVVAVIGRIRRLPGEPHRMHEFPLGSLRNREYCSAALHSSLK